MAMCFDNIIVCSIFCFHCFQISLFIIIIIRSDGSIKYVNMLNPNYTSSHRLAVVYWLISAAALKDTRANAPLGSINEVVAFLTKMKSKTPLSQDEQRAIVQEAVNRINPLLRVSLSVASKLSTGCKIDVFTCLLRR
jgi:hypothetical protein